VRRLIVNADDFGLTAGVNRAVLDAHQRGIVTSTTLMACGSKFSEAVALAAQSPRLSVGCHVLLVDGSPVLEAARVSSITSNSSDQHFHDSLLTFACRAVTRKLDEEQIESEITAQIRKLQSAGIQVRHLDSHKHTHIFPAVFRPMIRAAKTCGVRAIRNPFEPLLFASARQWKRSFQLTMLQSFRASFRRALEEAGLFTPDGCIGVVATGGMTLQTFRDLIERLPEGTWELVTHPGYNDPDLALIKTRLRASRERELEVLTSPAARELLHENKIALISYAEFSRAYEASPEVPAPLSQPHD
jgi:hopanoid biosynthesis associated protein HpnK